MPGPECTASGWLRGVAGLLLALAATASCAEASRDYVEQWVDVEVGASGALDRFEWVKGGLGAHTATVERHLRQWAFEPPRKDGSVVAGRTSLRLNFKLHRQGHRNWTLELQTVHPSPRIESTVPPRYPVEELRRRRQASVLLQIDYDAAGTRTGLYRVDTGKVPERFVKASAAAAVHWRVIPERLDGAPQAGSIMVPVAFEIGGPARQRQSRTLQLPGGVELNLQMADDPRRIWSSHFKLRPPTAAPLVLLLNN